MSSISYLNDIDGTTAATTMESEVSSVHVAMSRALVTRLTIGESREKPGTGAK